MVRILVSRPTAPKDGKVAMLGLRGGAPNVDASSSTLRFAIADMGIRNSGLTRKLA